MNQAAVNHRPVGRLSLVRNIEIGVAVKNSTASCEPSKKIPFDGFSESDRETTKNIQYLYSQKFSAKRIPQDVVASMVGWSQSTLNLYINGKQKVGEKALRKFCVLFSVTPDLLSPEYNNDKFNSAVGATTITKELYDIKLILKDLVDAVDGKRDLGVIMMRAKKCIVNA